MHELPESSAPQDIDPNDNRPWWQLLNKYHWFVLTVAALGWLFDTMDQQLFNLARAPAMRELLKPSHGALSAADFGAAVSFYSGLSTAIFLIGWATGGIVFGVLGDRVGRAKTMLWTILVYSLCTGLSAFSTSFWDFAFYRFITGLGVGGEFAVGVALVAEVMPHRARPFALGLLQALSAVGNISAALIGMGLGHIERSEQLADLNIFGFQMNAWRLMFVVGTLPALLAILIRRNLKEPEQWLALKREDTIAREHERAGTSHTGSGKAPQKLGSFADLFGDPRWRPRAIVGLLLAFSGVVGLWGIGFFSFDLFQSIFRRKLEAEGMPPEQIAGQLGIMVGVTSIMQNLGGFFGIYAYSYITHYIGRRPAFAISYVAAGLSTALVFSQMNNFYPDVFWMIPLMGFCQLSLFGGFAIYFPELFPTRLRSTGTSFCYNVGRFVAAIGPFTFGMLSSQVFGPGGLNYPEPMRYAGVSMCVVFVIGLLALPFAPETKGQPLPE